MQRLKSYLGWWGVPCHVGHLLYQLNNSVPWKLILEIISWIEFKENLVPSLLPLSFLMWSKSWLICNNNKHYFKLFPLLLCPNVRYSLTSVLSEVLIKAVDYLERNKSIRNTMSKRLSAKRNVALKCEGNLTAACALKRNRKAEKLTANFLCLFNRSRHACSRWVSLDQRDMCWAGQKRYTNTHTLNKHDQTELVLSSALFFNWLSLRITLFL